MPIIGSHFFKYHYVAYERSLTGGVHAQDQPNDFAFHDFGEDRQGRHMHELQDTHTQNVNTLEGLRLGRYHLDRVNAEYVVS